MKTSIFLPFAFLLFLSINSFSQPDLVSPSNGSTNISCEITLHWIQTSGTPSQWELHYSTFSNFGSYTQKTGNYSGTSGSYSFAYMTLSGNTKYYWRVRTKFNTGIWSSFSSIWNFTTAQRLSTSLNTPGQNATNINVPVNFNWMYSPGASHYHLFIRSNTNNYEFVIQSGSTTSYSWTAANLNTNYWWKLRPDAMSMGFTTPEWAFTTRSTAIRKISEILPTVYELYQNYPNPFNSKTNIKFNIPSNVKGESSNVKLTVFDLIGKEITALVNEKLQPGTYQVSLDAGNMASGIYYYNLTSNNFSETKKMVLIK